MVFLLLQYAHHCLNDAPAHISWPSRTTTLLIVALFALVQRLRKNRGANAFIQLPLPPGPRGLPLFGSLPFLGKHLHVSFAYLAQQYGPIFQLYLGRTRVLVLSSPNLVREAFRQPVFNGRPDNELTKIIEGYGVVNSNGALWQEQRAFLHSMLRQFGAKGLSNVETELEKTIRMQANKFAQELRQEVTSAKAIRPRIARAVSNVVGQLFMGDHYKLGQESHFKRLLQLMEEGFRLVSVVMPANFLPLLKHFPGIRRAYEQIRQNRAETSKYFSKITESHKRTLDPDRIRDICDAYLLKQQQLVGKKSFFSEAQLLQTLNDMFSSGVETVTSTLDWSFMLLVRHKHVQRKMQNEIHQVCGFARLPELRDLPHMPYTMACFYEVLRKSNIAPLGHVHMTLKDTTLNGYRIPKGTHVLSNLYAIHMDPNLWKNPNEFRPERFLCDGKLIKPNCFMPFSVGRRMCLGDVLTKQQYFLFITSLLFHFNLEEGEKKPSDKHVPGALISPKPYAIRFVPRFTDVV